MDERERLMIAHFGMDKARCSRLAVLANYIWRRLKNLKRIK